MTSLILIIILGILPSFAWLLLYLREDPHPEPKKNLVFVFFLGVLAALPIAALELGFWELSFQMPSGLFHSMLWLLFGLALIEEVGKFLAVKIGISGSKEFDEPVDAMIYMIVGALGFAAAENTTLLFTKSFDIVWNPFSFLSTIQFDFLVTITVLRFLGATFLHTLVSAVIGYWWARSIITGRKIELCRGLILGVGLHTFFNYLIILLDSSIVLYTTSFLVFIAIFVFKDFQKLRLLNP